MKIIIQRSKDKQFYFTVHAENGQVLVTSETYKRKKGCYIGIESLRTNFASGFSLSELNIIEVL
jgi:uncharacterized protein YegP (UPF0339 family)